jgi:succinate dehydrogenase/fumarate reductase cytochrome b subunit
MNPMPENAPESWEQVLDRELKGLPDRPAPATLVPRVMETIALRSRLPWYRQAWSTWPRSVQASALVLLSFLLGALTYACLHFPELGTPEVFSARVETWLAPLKAAWSVCEALLQAVAALCHKSGGWICIGLGVACLAAYLVAVGAGTMLYRLACSQRGEER